MRFLRKTAERVGASIGPTLALSKETVNLLQSTQMHIICSWCRKEGGSGLVGEKDPLEDRRETHGICLAHYETARMEWRVAAQASGKTDVGRNWKAPDVQRVVIDAREQFRLSPVRWWSGLKQLVRKAAGF